MLYRVHLGRPNPWAELLINAEPFSTLYPIQSKENLYSREVHAPPCVGWRIPDKGGMLFHMRISMCDGAALRVGVRVLRLCP